MKYLSKEIYYLKFNPLDEILIQEKLSFMKPIDCIIDKNL